MLRKIVTLALVVFCAALSWAQFTMNVQYQHVDSLAWTGATNNVSNCVNQSCWHLSNNTLVEVYSSGGLTLGVNLSGQVLEFSDYPNNTWNVQTAMGVIRKVTSGSGQYGIAITGTVPSATVYALKSDSACGNNYHVIQWTGSAWINTTGCAVSIAGAEDGTLLAINIQGLAYVSSNQGATWTQIAAGQSWSSGSVASATEAAFVRQSDGVIFKWISGTLTATTGVGKQAAVSGGGSDSTTTTGVSTLYVLNSAGDVYFFTPSQTWTLLARAIGGRMNFLTNGNTMNLWGIGPSQSGSNTWRFADQGLQAITTLTGNTACNPNCGTANHTPHAQVSWAGKHTGGGTIYGQTVPAAQTITPLTAQDTLIDPFGCFEDDPSCEILPASLDGVDCTIKGSNFYDSPISIGGELPGGLHSCSASFKNLGEVPGSCALHEDLDGTRHPPTECDYFTATWCANTNNPDYHLLPPAAIRTSQIIGDQTFGWTTALGICFRPGGYAAVGVPWLHIPIPFQLVEVLHYFGPTSCTYNP